jgi:hypothetical protein
MRFRKGISVSTFRINDDSSMNCSSCPTIMCMPPYCSFFSCQMYNLFEHITWFNWALCYVYRSIWPWIPHLSCPMPTIKHSSNQLYIHLCALLVLYYIGVIRNIESKIKQVRKLSFEKFWGQNLNFWKVWEQCGRSEEQFSINYILLVPSPLRDY